MSDTQQNGQETAEGQLQEPMPSSNEPAEAQQEPTLPDGVKERTAEEFEKLKATNKALKEELDAVKGPRPNSVLDELRPRMDAVPQATAPIAGQQQVPSPQEQVFDDGGYVDTALLNRRLNEANERAKQAEITANRAVQETQRFQETEVVKRVHEQYPELDPNNVEKFNPEFYKKVKLELLDQVTTKGQQDLMSAASEVKRLYYTDPTQQQAQQAKVQKVISSREQASAQTGTSKGTTQPIERDALVAGTRKGDPDAIFKRLQASGY